MAQPPTSAERGLAAAMQQIGASVDLYAAEMQRQLAAKDARIAELEKLCGDPCKPPPKVADKMNGR